jgi:hypothetical protein
MRLNGWQRIGIVASPSELLREMSTHLHTARTVNVPNILVKLCGYWPVLDSHYGYLRSL